MRLNQTTLFFPSFVSIPAGIIIVGICLALSIPLKAHAGGKSGELIMAPALTHELNLALKAGDGLHKALLTKDDEQVEMSLRDLVWQLDRTKGALGYAKLYERGHLLRILEAAKEQFEYTQRAFGEERRSHLAEGYNQLVNLLRIYQLDRAYSIFFCPKDHTTWVQRGGRAVNPFQPSSNREPCGIRVTK